MIVCGTIRSVPSPTLSRTAATSDLSMILALVFICVDTRCTATQYKATETSKQNRITFYSEQRTEVLL
jgi:hypothetical protein